MNGIVLKTILGFIGLILFSGLVFYSFFVEDVNSIANPKILEFTAGEHVHQVTSGGKLTKTTTDFKNLPDFTGLHILEKNIDIYSSIYSSTNEYEILESGDTITIKIGTGSYLFDFKSPFKKVIIQGEIYDIHLDNGGMVYIEDSLSYSMVTSLNTIAKLSFMNRKTDMENIETYLYPHMYLGFSPKRFKVRKNLDSLRVSQLGKLGYFSESFGELLENKSINFAKDRLFFLNSLGILKFKQKQNEKTLEGYKELEIRTFPGIGYIEKYYTFFYNDRKKIVYLKNKIFGEVIELLLSTENQTSVIQTIVNDLTAIKQLSEVEYNNLMNLVQGSYSFTFSSLDDDRDIVNKNFSNLIAKLEYDGKKVAENFHYNFNKLNFIGEKSLYLQLFQTFSLTNDIGIPAIQYDYYLFFIKKVILAGFNDRSLTNKYFGPLVELFYKYSQNINTKSNIDPTDTRTITNIISNEEILQSIKDEIDQRFFKGRSDQKLLLLNSNSFKGFSNLELAVNNILNFYNGSKVSLFSGNSKYIELVKHYSDMEGELKESFSALTNYSLYQKNYSKVNKELIDVEVYTDTVTDIISVGKFYRYISKFSGINISGVNIKIIDDYYYKVENIVIGGVNFSFDLYPYKSNRLENIIINNTTLREGTREYGFYSNLKNTTYDLDEEKEKYEEIGSKIISDNKGEYEFKNFFINNFFPDKKKIIAEYVGDKGAIVESDDVIVLFKSAKLLGNKGEFITLKEVLDIEYNDLQVEKKGDDFSIHIKEAILKGSIKDGSQDVGIYAKLDADYMLKGGSHYFFNVFVKPYTLSTDKEKNYVFSNENLALAGNIDIEDFKEKMQEMFESLGTVKKQIQTKGLNMSRIKYNLESRELIFR